jgi:hypothetical protein
LHFEDLVIVVVAGRNYNPIGEAWRILFAVAPIYVVIRRNVGLFTKPPSENVSQKIAF